VALQAGALYEGADFKIELIVYFLGHWFHLMPHDSADFMFKRFEFSKNLKKRFHTTGQGCVQVEILSQVLFDILFNKIL
jgi:hypothetical protein